MRAPNHQTDCAARGERESVCACEDGCHRASERDISKQWLVHCDIDENVSRMELSVLLDPRESVVLLEFGKSVIRAPCVGCGAGRRDGRESDVADVGHLVSTERETRARSTPTTPTRRKPCSRSLSHTHTRTSVGVAGGARNEALRVQRAAARAAASEERATHNDNDPERSRARVCSSSSSSLPMSPRSCSEPARRESLFISRDPDVKVSESLLLID